jgi:sugar/nucleoside kinase (ribokinase family)
MDQPLTVVVVGHICLDLIPSLDGLPAGQFGRLFQPGHLLEVGEAALSTGGSVPNTGLALHRLGIPVRLIGKLGDDLFGAAVRQVLQAEGAGLADQMAIDPRAHTSYTVIVSPPGVDRTFLHYPGANETFCAADVPPHALAGAGLLHLGYPPLLNRMYADGGQELVALFRAAKRAGVTTSLDMSLPDPAAPAGQADWRAICRAALPFVDIFLPSVEELLFMLRREAYDRLVSSLAGESLVSRVDAALLGDLAGEVLEMGVKIFGLKLGDRGLYLRTAGARALADLGRAAAADPAAWADRELWAPCFQVAVAGTTGAGDSTIAGFLSAFVRGFTPEQAVTAAVAVGACNVEAPDATSGIRSWDATLARIASGWPRRALPTPPGWTWDAVEGVFSHK